MPPELDLALRVGIPVLLVVIGLFSGKWVERRHYASIEEREITLRPIPVTTTPAIDPVREIASSRLVVGSVVISVDAFKSLVGSLQTFFGGRVTGYESLVDRARREAVLRMLEEGDGAHAFVNLRVETSMVGQGEPGDSVSSVEALAYATAVEYRS